MQYEFALIPIWIPQCDYKFVINYHNFDFLRNGYQKLVKKRNPNEYLPKAPDCTRARIKSFSNSKRLPLKLYATVNP